ncbi:MAG: hypothetical protein AB8I08_12035 [Sandaracinaceae bacterium]
MSDKHLIVVLAVALLSACGSDAAEPAATTDETTEPGEAPEAPADAPLSCDALMAHLFEVYSSSDMPLVDATNRAPLTHGCTNLQASDGWSEHREAAECSMGASDDSALAACGFETLFRAFGRASEG